jgi:hypothetical protein
MIEVLRSILLILYEYASTSASCLLARLSSGKIKLFFGQKSGWDKTSQLCAISLCVVTGKLIKQKENFCVCAKKDGKGRERKAKSKESMEASEEAKAIFTENFHCRFASTFCCPRTGLCIMERSKYLTCTLIFHHHVRL